MPQKEQKTIDPESQAAELECQIIGCCLLQSQGTEITAKLLHGGLTEEWFTQPYCLATFSAIQRMFSRGDPIIELTTVWHELGGPGAEPDSAWLEGCVDIVPTGQFATYYLETLRPLYHRRRLAEDLARAAADSGERGVEEAHATLQHAMIDANERLAASAPEDLLKTRIKAIVEEFKCADKKTTWIGWPVPELDRTAGRVDKELVYIAARPSVGKTAFAVQMMIRAAKSQIPVAMKSLESPANQVIIRLLANLGEVNMLEIKQDRADHDAISAMEQAGNVLASYGELIRISDRPTTTAELAAWAQLEAAKGAKLLIIDNLKHIRPDPKIKTVVEQFRDFSRCIKAIRDDIALPVVVIHHLSRAGELSWSDDMERDADIVLHLSLQDKLSGGMDPKSRCVVSCEVRKNRDGIAGVSIPLLFCKDIQTFYPYTDEPEYD